MDLFTRAEIKSNISIELYPGLYRAVNYPLALGYEISMVARHKSG